MPPPPAQKKSLTFVTWRDVFALIDDGRATPAEYEHLGHRVITEALAFPRGVGALIIIPRDATPPRDEARAAMNQAMLKLGRSLRCLCWLVEGTGFQGAMVRAVLTGLKAFGRFAYPCHVSSSMTEAVGWIRHQLDGGDARAEDVDQAVRALAEQRRLWDGDDPSIARPSRP